MENNDFAIVEKFASENPELRTLWDNHILYEKQLEKLEGKNFRTPQEEEQVKLLKKQKLDGKTRLHTLLDEYRQKG